MLRKRHTLQLRFDFRRRQRVQVIKRLYWCTKPKLILAPQHRQQRIALDHKVFSFSRSPFCGAGFAVLAYQAVWCAGGGGERGGGGGAIRD
eukprot:SAG11_NODE_10024_length_862_cov_1.082569_2_plen_91_part_00